MEEKGGRCRVTGEDIGEQLQYALLRRFQHLVLSDGVERILEIELNDGVIEWKVMTVGPGSMGCCFCPHRRSKSQLERCQKQPYPFPDSPACHFGHQALKTATNRNGMHSSKKRGRICAGVSPDSTRLVNYISAVSSFLPPNPAKLLIKSLRCCGRRPSEPLGKDWMAWATFCSVTTKVGCRSFSRGGAGGMVSE